MRLLVLFATTALLAILPYVAGRRLSRAHPRAEIAVSLLTLLGLGMSTLFLLAAVVDPSNLPARAIPGLVERCADAVGTVFAHPVQHWPRIGAALLLLALLVRIVLATVLTVLDARRAKPHGQGLVSTTEDLSDLVVIGDARPVAYTQGILRGQVVVSTGLLTELDAPEMAAVIEHERAHVRGRHIGLLFFGRIISRAFGFLLPVRRAAEQLILGLEIVADDAAAARVGDPLLVARALASVAELAVTPSVQSTLSAAASDVRYRVQHLAESARTQERPRISPWAGATVVLTACLFVVQLLVLPASGRSLTDAAESRAAHHICHLPHPSSTDA